MVNRSQHTHLSVSAEMERVRTPNHTTVTVSNISLNHSIVLVLRRLVVLVDRRHAPLRRNNNNVDIVLQKPIVGDRQRRRLHHLVDVPEGRGKREENDILEARGKREREREREKEGV